MKTKIVDRLKEQKELMEYYGVKPNAYSSRVQSEVLLEDLFAGA